MGVTRNGRTSAASNLQSDLDLTPTRIPYMMGRYSILTWVVRLKRKTILSRILNPRRNKGSKEKKQHKRHSKNILRRKHVFKHSASSFFLENIESENKNEENKTAATLRFQSHKLRSSHGIARSASTIHIPLTIVQTEMRTFMAN